MAVRQSALETITVKDDLPLGEDPLLIATTGVETFRCVVVDRYLLEHGVLKASPTVLRTLGVGPHSEVRVTPLRPGRTVL